MEIVILLVPLGLILAGVAVAAFMWGLRRGQFDDLDSRGWNVVFDDRARDNREPGRATGEQDDPAKDDPVKDDNADDAHEATRNGAGTRPSGGGDARPGISQPRESQP